MINCSLYHHAANTLQPSDTVHALLAGDEERIQAVKTWWSFIKDYHQCVYGVGDGALIRSENGSEIPTVVALNVEREGHSIQELPQRILEELHAQPSDEDGKGYALLLDTRWVPTADVQQLVDFQQSFNQVFAEQSVSVLCLHDSQRFDDADTIRLLMECPRFIVADQICHNIFWTDQTDPRGRVTERLLSSFRLQYKTCERYQKLAYAVEQSPSMVAITDVQGRLEYVNPKFEKVTGYQQSEVLGKNPRILKSGTQTKEFYRQLWETVIQGNEWHGSFHNRRKDGSEYWESASISPMCNGRQNITHFLKVSEDITEQVQYQQSLRQERDVLEKIMETSPAGITVVDKTGQVVYANARAEEIFGLLKEEITQRSYNEPSWKITDYDGVPVLDEDLPFQHVCRTREPVYDFRHAVEWADGTRVLLSINAAPVLGADGEVESVVCAIEDVTERTLALKARITRLERELEVWESYVAQKSTSVTASAFGIRALRDESHEGFMKFQYLYSQIIDQTMEEKMFYTERKSTLMLRTLAEQLGDYRAGPRDVMDIHTMVLRHKSTQCTPDQFQRYAEEGRLVVLELMGYLVTYYRNRNLQVAVEKK